MDPDRMAQHKTEATPLFEIQDVRISIGDKEIVKGVSLKIRAGEKHALMGPNGSGKSTLANALMGHPSYRLTGGRILLAGQDVTELASMAKLKAGRLAREVPDACMQFWGGMGYMWENPVGRAYRDARLSSIGGGADEIMLGIISKHMGILPRKD